MTNSEAFILSYCTRGIKDPHSHYADLMGCSRQEAKQQAFSELYTSDSWLAKSWLDLSREVQELTK